MPGNSYNTNDRKAVHIPATIWNSLRTEFDLSEGDMEAFIVNSLDKIAMEHNHEINSKTLTQDETNEIEDNLKGLGYL
jgi:phenylalanyl-tRNA synthetase beta subunit